MCVDMCSIVHCNTEKRKNAPFSTLCFTSSISPHSQFVVCIIHNSSRSSSSLVHWTEISIKRMNKRTDGRTAREELCSTACCLLCVMLKRMKESCPLQNVIRIFFFSLYPLRILCTIVGRVCVAYAAYKHQAHKHGPSNFVFCIQHR